MTKRKLLVCDQKKSFCKMFRRNIKSDFEFYEHNWEKIKEEKNVYDFLIFVVYTEFELFQVVALYRKRKNIIIYIGNKFVLSNFNFSKEIGNLFFLDGSRSKSEILEQLKFYFSLN